MYTVLQYLYFKPRIPERNVKAKVMQLVLLHFSRNYEVKWKLLIRVRLCDLMGYTVRGILQARILE